MSRLVGKSLRPLAKELRAAGCVLTTSRSGHVHVVLDGRLVGVLSVSPSNTFALKRARSDFKRQGILK